MMRFSYWLRTKRPSLYQCLLFFVATSALAADWQPQAEWRTDWTQAGVPGGIVNRTNIQFNAKADLGAVGDGVADDTAAIKHCFEWSKADGAVNYIPAGTYRITSPISLVTVANPIHRNLTVRGAGPGQTILLIDTGLSGANGAIALGAGEQVRPLATLAITSGADRGSSNVTVSSTASIAVNKLARIEQQDPDWVHPINGQTNTMSYIVMVTAKDATTVSFWPPLPITLTNSPTVASYPTYLIRGLGVEDLTVEMTNSAVSSAFYLTQTYGCWFKNVEVVHASRRQIWLNQALNCQVTHSYFHGSRGGGPNHEGLDFYEDCCWNLVDDNLSVNGGFPSIIFGDSRGGCAGNVIAYNYAADVDSGSGVAGWAFSDNHGPHNSFNLFEGNIGPGYSSDGYFGGSSHGTLFRNWFTGFWGFYPDMKLHPIAVNLGHWAYFYTIVGNVLGTNTYSALYSTEVANYRDYQPLIYRLGYPNSGNSTYTGTNPPTATSAAFDSTVKSNTVRVANWDYATGGVVDPTNNLPASLYLTSAPAWWNDYGTLAWPPIDPTLPTLGTLPAQLRFNTRITRPRDGASPFMSHSVSVGPSASELFTMTPTSGRVPLTVLFTNKTSVARTLDFGDGVTNYDASSGAHTYQRAGVYFPTLLERSYSYTVVVTNSP